MTRRPSALLALPLLAFAASGCHETEASVDLNAKGGATLAVGVKFTKAFLTPLAAYEKAAPPEVPSLGKELEPLFLKNPEPDLRKELEEKGLKILVLDSKKGVYALEGAFPVRVGGALHFPPGEEGKDVKALVQQIVGTLTEGKSKVTMTVPGEVLDFSPSGIGISQAPKGSPRAPHRTVVFHINQTSLPRCGLGMDQRKGYYLPLVLRVRFKTPGRSLPADALWDGKGAEAGAPK